MLTDQERTVLDAAVNILRSFGSPLVCPADGIVHVAKLGVWAHGTTLSEALVALHAKLAERDAQKSGR